MSKQYVKELLIFLALAVTFGFCLKLIMSIGSADCRVVATDGKAYQCADGRMFRGR